MRLLINGELGSEHGVFVCFRAVLVKRMPGFAEQDSSPPQLKRLKVEPERKGLFHRPVFPTLFTGQKAFCSLSSFPASVAVCEEGVRRSFRCPHAALAHPGRSDGGSKRRSGNRGHTMTPSVAMSVSSLSARSLKSTPCLSTRPKSTKKTERGK